MIDFPAAYAVPVALTAQAHDRAGHRRRDQEWLEASFHNGAAVLLLARGEFPVLLEDGERPRVQWLSADDVPSGRRAFLGTIGERDYWVVVTAQKPDLESGQWQSMYGVGQDLEPWEQGLLVHAHALANWYASHRFCPSCGSSVVATEAGYVLKCESSAVPEDAKPCAKQHFPRADPAVIMLVTDGERALLGHQAAWPEGRFSTLAGFVDPGESFEAAVRREVWEEVGIEVGEVRYFGNQPWPFPASMMIGFFAEATSHDIAVNHDELAEARWFTREELKAQAETGEIALPGGFSISRSLIEAWYGDSLPGRW